MRTSILRLLALMSCSRAAGVVQATAQGVHATAAESAGKVVGTVTTPDGYPIAGATIGLTFLATDSAQMPTRLPMFTSDASGEFLASYLPPRNYSMVARVSSGFGQTQSVRIEPGRVATVHLIFDTSRGASETGGVPGPGVVVGSRGATFAIPLAWLKVLRGGLEGIVSWDSAGRPAAARPGPAGLRIHVADSVIGRGSLSQRLRSGRVYAFSIQPTGAIDGVVEQEEPPASMRLQGAMLIVDFRSGTAFNDLWRSRPDSVRVDDGTWRGGRPPAGWLTVTQVLYLD